MDRTSAATVPGAVSIPERVPGWALLLAGAAAAALVGERWNVGGGR